MSVDSPASQPKPAMILMVLFSRLYIPDWNPRKLIDESALGDLVNFIRSGNQVPRIILWWDAEKGLYAIVEGQMRYLAATQLGWTQIEAEVIDCTLEEAKDRANFSNNHNPPFWLDKYEGWAARFAAHPEWKTQADMAAHLGVADRWVGRCINLLDVLNEDARKFIKESAG